MTQLPDNALASLWLLHWPKAAASQHLPADAQARLAGAGLYLDTCLRQLALGLGPPPTPAPDAAQQPGHAVPAAGELLPGELLTGGQAYRFALEVATGLRSAVPGETNVFGQLKRAWQRCDRELQPAQLARLRPVVERLFHDAKHIREHYLQGAGGCSYGSLVRRLLAPRAGERILIIGAGDLARSLLPFLRAFDVGIWNHRLLPTAFTEEVFTGRWFAPADALRAGQWADHVVLTTPRDDAHDHAWNERLGAGSARGLVHLGRRRSERLAWHERLVTHDLDDVFALAQSQQGLRARQLALARLACEARARERLTPPPRWHDAGLLAARPAHA